MPRSGGKHPPNFTNGKGATLSTFIDFFLCAGQKQSAPLGYSPLPLNLVEGGLLQADAIPGHVAGPNPSTLAGCDNPTLHRPLLTILKDAPQPSPCDKVGEPLNCVVKNGKATTPAAAAEAARPRRRPARPASPRAACPPAARPPARRATATGAGPVTGGVVNVAGDGASRAPLGVLTAVGIIVAIAAPPALGSWLRRRKRQATG